MNMKLRKIFINLLITGAFMSCSRRQLDRLLDNPNTPSPTAANADLYLTQVQLSFAGFFDGASDFGMQLTRQTVFFGPTYGNGYVPQSYDGLWETAYASIVKNADALIPIAEAQKKYVNVGMTRILKAYTMMTLVDIFGDVPFIEANLGVENTNPKADNGKDVYAAAIALLDAAIADLAKPPGSYPGSQDLFYGAGNATGAKKWVTLAKTLKLRAYVQTRLADAGAKAKIDALLTENDLIDTQAEDFEFKYSTKQANPNSRHPKYNNNYTSTNDANDYMSTWFMWALVQEKGTGNANNDPRTRYYFYRQRTNFGEANESSMQCINSAPPAHYPAGTPFCYLISGYWGRDHGDNSGIPPHGNLRTTVGIYPFGGDFDASQGTSVSLNRGAQGAGIEPIWLSVFTEFIKAEAALILTTAGDPKTLLESGVRKSFTKVFGFPATASVTITNPALDMNLPANQPRLDGYVSKVLALYDAATTTNEKLDVIMKEYYIALWGNGLDAYNNYRRTGKPTNMQPTRLVGSGEYIRSHLYPSVYINRNQNAVQKSSVGLRVFWDTNPPGFIK